MTAQLGQSEDPEELVPGSVAEADALAADWSAHAASAGDLAAAIRRQSVLDDWSGPAADAYEVKVLLISSALAALGQSLAGAAGAVSAYSGVLQAAQQHAERAAETWRAGQEASRAALKAPAPAVPGWAYRAPADDPGQPLRDAAQEELDHARTIVAAAAARAQAALEAGLRDLPAHVDFWGSDAAALAALTPAQALGLAETLTPAQLADLVRHDPRLLDDLKKAGPAAVAAWWKATSPAGRAWWAAHEPALIGNLDGVDYTTRDQINRKLLPGDIAAAQKRIEELARKLAGAGPEGRALYQRDLENAQSELAGLENIQDTLDWGAANHYPLMLASLVPGAQPLAQIGVGNLDTASNITVMVPGMNTGTDTGSGAGTHGDSSLYQWVKGGIDLRVAQQQRSGLPIGSFGELVWFGYHPPMNADFPAVFGDGAASAGAPALASSIGALNALHPGGTVNAIAHSYGTPTLAYALQSSHVDNAVFAGSVGIPDSVPDAAALDVPAGHVFATQAVHDGFGPLGQDLDPLGRADPTGAAFGARDFSSEAATVGGQPLQGVAEHGPFGGAGSPSYLDNGTTSQYRIAQITTGQGSAVPFGGTHLDRDAVPGTPTPAFDGTDAARSQAYGIVP